MNVRRSYPPENGVTSGSILTPFCVTVAFPFEMAFRRADHMLL